MIPQSPQAHSVSESFTLRFDSGFFENHILNSRSPGSVGSRARTSPSLHLRKYDDMFKIQLWFSITMILIILAPKAGGQDDDHDFNYHDDGDYHYYLYHYYPSLHLRQATALVNDNASRGSRQRRHLHLEKKLAPGENICTWGKILAPGQNICTRCTYENTCTWENTCTRCN